MRIVVVGAGMAGLTATRQLLLERSRRHADRGRVAPRRPRPHRARTVRATVSTSRAVPSGSTRTTTACASCCDRHGMELQGEGQQWTTIRRLAVSRRPAAEPGRSGRRGRTGSSTVVRGDRARRSRGRRRPGEPAAMCIAAAELDAVSLADVADRGRPRRAGRGCSTDATARASSPPSPTRCRCCSSPSSARSARRAAATTWFARTASPAGWTRWCSAWRPRSPTSIID